MNIDKTIVREIINRKILFETHNFILKSNSRNTNWVVDPSTQVKAAEDINCQRQNPSQIV